MSSIEVQLLAAATLLILCVVASKATSRLGIPTLVVFLGVGILAGSEGIGRIEFNDALTTQSLGIIALTYILFSGGLDTKWSAIKPVMKTGLALSTIGVMLTCLLMGSFMHYVLHFPLMESYLIGAIVSSTDAGAVFTVLRSKNIHLKGPLKPLLELESGSNDPMAVFMTTTILQMMQNPDLTLVSMIPLLFKQMIVGGLIGFYAGKILVWLFNHVKLQIEGLYTVMSIAVVIFIYSITQNVDGNGFLAVYIAGVVLGNHSFVFKKSLSLMHDGISWLMQSVMLLTLGLLIYPSRVIDVSSSGFLIASFMILLARPISVFISLAFSNLNLREKLLISWVGLRGSVPVVMATYPLVAGIDRTGLILNLVFFIAVTSLIIQGTSISFIAKLLKVKGASSDEETSHSTTPGLLNDIVTVDVPLNSPIVDKTIIELGLPHNKVLIVAIERKGSVIIPRGSTPLRAGDKISIMADDDSLADFVELLWVPKAPPPRKRYLKALKERYV